MRKFRFLLVTLFSLMSTSLSFAINWTDDNGVTWTFDVTKYNGETGAYISKAINYSTELTVPNRVYDGGNAYDVISLGYPNTGQYQNNIFGDKTIRKIILPSTLKFIGGCAFKEFRDLTEIIMPEHVEHIGYSAFYNCKSLTSLYLPSTLTGIENYAFYGCSNLKSITVPASVASIGDRAFSSCTELQKAEILSKDVTMSDGIFEGCRNIVSMTIPYVGTVKNPTNAYRNTVFGILFDYSYSSSSGGINQLYNSNSDYDRYYYHIPQTLREVTVLGGKLSYGSFSNCSMLTKVTLGDDVEMIGDKAFSGCKNLQSVTIGNNITSIGGEAFNGCSNLENIELNEGLERIGTDAFKEANAIKSITLPSSLLSIGDNAFNNMHSLASIIVNAPVPATLDAITSINNSSIIFIPSTLLPTYKEDSNWGAHQGQFIAQGTSSEYDVKVTALSDKSALHIKIGEENLQNVVTLKVSGTINSYDLMIMRDKMVNLKYLDLSDASIVANNYLYYSNNGDNYCSIDNTLTRYALQPNLFSIKLPETLKTINDYALAELTHVDELLIPSSVESIGVYAARDLKYLKKFTFAENATIKTIGSLAFSNCESLTEFSIPGSVTSLPQIFGGVVNIATLRIEDGDLPLPVSNMGTSSRLKNLYIGRDIIPSSSYNVFSGSLSKVVFAEGVTTLLDKVFNKSTTSDTIVVPTTLKSIGLSAFGGAKEIYISSLKSWSNIDNLVSFMSSYGDKNIYLNGLKIETLDLAGIETLPKYAFCHTTISGLTIPTNSTLAEIPDYAFAYTNIDKLQMPISIKKIGDFAFYTCPNLAEVKLPSSINNIGNNAFNECPYLNDVYTYTIEPQEIDRFTFSTYGSATLHVPHVSYYNYYYGTQWSQFLKLVDFDEPYDYIFIDKDVTIDENTGDIDGTPDADINAGGGLIVDGIDQKLDEIHIKFDGTANIGASLIGKVHANKIYLDIEVKADFWYYFSFPFDVKLMTIQKSGGYVFRYYDSESRANGETANWKNVAAGTEHLTAGNGYIFRTNTAGTLSICIDKQTIEKFDLTLNKVTTVNSYTATTGTTENDNKSWNFIGNPYLCYYSINDLDYGAPIIVWNGNGYEAYRPGDDDYTFYPFQAFFIQKPENVEGVGFDTDGQTTYIQSQNTTASSAKRRARAAKLNQDRKLINLELTDGTTTDKTRVVFNDKQSLAYEAECDAAKFAVTEGVPQMYSLDADGIKYSINERPVSDGKVQLGISVPQKGDYTISAARMDAHVFLEDAETGTLHDLAEGEYTFSSEAGAYAKRFTLVLANDEATAIALLNAQDNSTMKAGETYDLNGRRAKNAKGVVIKDGKKVYVK